MTGTIGALAALARELLMPVLVATERPLPIKIIFKLVSSVPRRTSHKGSTTPCLLYPKHLQTSRRRAAPEA